MDNINDTTTSVEKTKELFEYEMTEVLRRFRREAEALLKGFENDYANTDIPAASFDYRSPETAFGISAEPIAVREFSLEMPELKTDIPEVEIAIPAVISKMSFAPSVSVTGVDKELFGQAAAETPSLSFDFGKGREAVSHGESAFLNETIYAAGIPKGLSERFAGIKAESVSREAFAETAAAPKSFGGKVIPDRGAPISVDMDIDMPSRAFENKPVLGADSREAFAVNSAAFEEIYVPGEAPGKFPTGAERTFAVDSAAFAEIYVPAAGKPFRFTETNAADITVDRQAFEGVVVNTGEVSVTYEAVSGISVNGSAFGEVGTVRSVDTGCLFESIPQYAVSASELGITAPVLDMNFKAVDLKEVKVSDIVIPENPRVPDLSRSFEDILDSVRKGL